VWSFGCLVIEMLSGRHPWYELRHQHTLGAMYAMAKSTTGPSRPEGRSPEAIAFIDACLQLKPEQRARVAELLQHPWLSTTDTTTATATTTTTTTATDTTTATTDAKTTPTAAV
jgi:serine/threonine protein kinase